MGRAFAAAVEGLNEAARQLGAALARAHAGRVPPWQVPAGQRRRDYGLVR